MGFSDIPTCLSTCTLSSEYSNWLPLASMIIFIVLLGISIGFMISRFLNRRDWEAMIRLELYHLSVAVIWIGLIAIVANITCSLSCSITKDESPFTSSINYLNTINSKLSSIINSLYEKAKNIRIETAYYDAFANFMYSPKAGCDNVASVYENFSFMLSPFVASLLIQQYALIFISQIAFTYLLPIGIILRLIPGFKDASSYVIAIAFSFYIILPLTYIFAQKATEGISLSTIDTDANDCVSANEIQTILTDVGLILPQAVFFPALSSIITIGAARALAEIFKYDFIELRG
ncbi:MAG: hypothetical protein QW054_00245 [Candidatus Micrarchaeia archaeon]